MMSSSAGRPHILIVEDNPTLAHLIIRQLEGERYETTHAADGTAAWQLLERGDPPDLILLDMLATGIGGLALCRRIRATPRLAHVPVILVTALVDSPSRLAGLEAGANDFLSRPWSKAELYVRVRTLLDLRATHDTLQRRQRQLDLLFGVGRGLSETSTVDEMLAAVVARATEAMGATNGTIVLVDAQGPKRKIAVDETQAPGVIVPPVLNEVEHKVATWVIESGRPLLVADTAAEEGWADAGDARSLMAAPLMREQRIRGFVQLTHREPNRFDQEALDLLEAVAAQTTAAIETRRLAERVQAERRRFAVLIYSMEDAVIATDREQRIVLTNPAGAALLGEREGDLRGRPIRALVEDETLRLLFARAAADGEPWAGDITWHDGRQLYATVSPVGEEGDEGDDGLVAVIQEVEWWPEEAPAEQADAQAGGEGPAVGAGEEE